MGCRLSQQVEQMQVQKAMGLGVLRSEAPLLACRIPLQMFYGNLTQLGKKVNFDSKVQISNMIKN